MKKKNILFILNLLLLFGCTVKNTNKIIFISNNLKRDFNYIKTLVDMNIGIVQVINSKQTHEKNTYLKIENTYYVGVWSSIKTAFNDRSYSPNILSALNPFVEKNKFMTPISSENDIKIKFEEEKYHIITNGKKIEADVIIWSLPVSSLKQENLINLDSAQFANSLLTPLHKDSSIKLKNIYYIPSDKDSYSTFSNITTILINHNEKK